MCKNYFLNFFLAALKHDACILPMQKGDIKNISKDLGLQCTDDQIDGLLGNQALFTNFNFN